MEFPHLKDTNFPDIKTVDVYKYENNFNYARWQGKTSIKLMNVLWNSNYSDVPYFNSVQLRDKWFDEQEGIVKPLESAFIVAPDNSVKIPIPYNDAYNYNYLVVDIPIMTSSNEPIDYEDENIRIKRFKTHKTFDLSGTTATYGTTATIFFCPIHSSVPVVPVVPVVPSLLLENFHFCFLLL